MPSETKVLTLAEMEANLEKAKAAVEAAKATAPITETEVVEVKEATVVTEKKVPSTGQSAPLGEFPFEVLNAKEKAVLARLNGSGQGSRQTVAIAVLSMETSWDIPPSSEAQANSWTRNSLRRLFRGGWVDKPGRGQYKISLKGRKRLKA